MIGYKILNRVTFSEYISEIIKLFRMCFTAPISERILRWRYIENPICDLNAVIAIDGDMVVGFIGTMPTEVCCQDQLIKAAMFTNMMTHPVYGGHGIFTCMVNLLESELLKKGYEFIYSFPNYLSNYILIDKFHWKDIYEIPRMELRHVAGLNESDNFTNCVSCDSDYVLDYSTVKPIYGMKSFNHLGDYAKWRVKDNPEHSYDNFVIKDGSSVRSYITVRKYKDEYNIVDFSLKSLEHGKILLRKVEEVFEKMEFRILTAWCPLNTSIHTLFENDGFTNRYPITYFAGKNIGGVLPSKLLTWDGWVVHAIDDNIY